MRSKRTAEDPEVDACIADGGQHDYRRFDGWSTDKDSSAAYWRCVWCHAVTCGQFGEIDPCWLPLRHKEPHLSRSGFSWPVGGVRV